MSSEVLLPLLPYSRMDHVFSRTGAAVAEREKSFDEIHRELSEKQANGTSSVIFPSHLLDRDDRAEVLSGALSCRLESWIQITPGAELAEFQASLLALPPSGLEVVFDRRIYDLDSARLKALDAQGWRLRYLFCVTPEFEAAEEIATLPEALRANLSVHFSSRLTSDEVFLIQSDLEERFPELRFQAKLNTKEFDSRNLRGSLRRAFEFKPTHILLVPAFYLLWAIQSPSRAARDFGLFVYWRILAVIGFSRRVAVSAYWKPRNFLESIGIAAYWLAHHLGTATYGQTRRVAVAVYWVHRRLLTFAYWKLRQLVTSPVWFFKTYLPPVYWVFIFPMTKTYWFSRFQLEKRVLARMKS